MTPYTQSILHDPANGQFGDCLRTCIGCLLDVEPDSIPHFGAMGEEWRPELQAWLRPRGLCLLEFNYFDQFEATCAKGVYHLLTGPSHTEGKDLLHCVVGLDGMVHHDPHPGGRGLYGSASKWIIGFIVHLNNGPVQ